MSTDLEDNTWGDGNDEAPARLSVWGGGWGRGKSLEYSCVSGHLSDCAGIIRTGNLGREPDLERKKNEFHFGCQYMMVCYDEAC